MFSTLVPLNIVLYFVTGFCLVAVSQVFRSKRAEVVLHSLFLICLYSCFAIACINLYQATFAIRGFNLLHYYGGFGQGVGIEHSLGAMQALFAVLVTSCALITGLGYDKDSNANLIFNKSLLLFASGAFVGLAYSNDIFNIYVFIEIASIALYSMIAIGGDKKSLQAAFNYLIIGSVASCFIVLGIILIYNFCGSLNISAINDRIALSLGGLNGNAVLFCYVIFILAALVKAAIFPFFAFLNEIYLNANKSQMPFIAGVGSKAGIFLLYVVIYRLFFTSLFEFFQISGLANGIVCVLSFGVLFLSIFATFRVQNIKSILTFSSIIYNTCMAIMLCICEKTWLDIVFVTMLCHGIVICFLFWLLSLSEDCKQACLKFNSKVRLRLFLGFVILLAAIPPSPLFATKFILLKMLYAKSMYVSFTTILLSSVFSLAYCYKIIKMLNHHDTLMVEQNNLLEIFVAIFAIILIYCPFIIEGINTVIY